MKNKISDQDFQKLIEAAKNFPPIPEEVINQICRDGENAIKEYRHRPVGISGRKSNPKYKAKCQFCGKEKILKLKDAKIEIGQYLEYWCCQACFDRYWAREDLYQDWNAGIVSDEQWPGLYRIRVDRAHLKLVEGAISGKQA